MTDASLRDVPRPAPQSVLSKPIDHSALAAFRENPERYRLEYALHLKPATPNDKMQAGSAIHAGLNQLRAGADVEAAVASARAVRGELPGARDANHVEKIVRAYAGRYPSEAEPFKVTLNETYAEAVIHGPKCAVDEHGARQFCGIALGCFAYCGIIDSGIEWLTDGAAYIMDCKSTGAYLNASWLDMLALGDQFVGYVALRRAQGHRCDGYYVDGIHVSDPRPRKDGSLGEPKVDPDTDFVRAGPFRVPEWRIERWARDVRYTLAQIVELERTRGFDAPWPVYQNWPYGKVDAYKDFYMEPAELHASTAQRFEVRVWDPRAEAAGRAAT